MLEPLSLWRGEKDGKKIIKPGANNNDARLLVFVRWKIGCAPDFLRKE
jgi:hypothetical protein